MAFGGNVIVLKIFSRFDQLRTPSNMLIMNLALSDLILTLMMMPECTYNFFCGGPWQFGKLACEIHAFSGKHLIVFNFISSPFFAQLYELYEI